MKIKNIRKNPENLAFNIGYENGKYDIENNQWQYEDIYQLYAAEVNTALEKNKFNKQLSDFKSFVIGYLLAMIEHSANKYPFRKDYQKIKEEFDNVRSNNNFINPLLADHSRVLQLISQGVDKLKTSSRDTTDFKNINSISIRLNQGDKYAEFILNNLVKFKYIKKNMLGFYKLTDKGKNIVEHIGILINGEINKWRLQPSQYKMMSDIQEFLK